MSRRRAASLRARLARTLVVLGLVSVLLLAAVNLLVVRSLLDGSVRTQLETLRDVRRSAIELGVERLLTRVSVLAADPGVVAALDDLATGYAALDADLTPAEQGALLAEYERVVARYDEAGVERPPVEALLPDTEAGRFVQFHYLASNPHPVGERSQLVDAGDGSPYSEAHARQHPYLRQLAEGLGATDLVLIDAASDDIVYSVEKLIDLGTDVRAGPHRDSTLGAARARLATVSVTQAVIVDSAFYLPDSSAPVVHVAATVRAEAEAVGAIVVGIPIRVLGELVSGGGRWDLLGLGDTGDAYVLGADGRLRTEPRIWSGDRARALEAARDAGLDDRSAALVEFLESPVLVQRVEHAAVERALDGEASVAQVSGYLGKRTLAAVAPLDVGGLGWVLVAERQTSETRQEIESFLLTIGLVLAVLLPVLALVGIVLARVLARPVVPLLAAAQQIADGDPDVAVPDLGRNELGDLGHQLDAVAAQLREQDEAVRAEDERIAGLLESVVPVELIDRVRREEDVTSTGIDTATVVALAVRGVPQPSAAELDTLVELTQRLVTEVRALAGAHGVEGIRLASDQALFVAGRGVPDDGVAAAVRFAVALDEVVAAVATEQAVDLVAQVGVATGTLGGGVLGRRQAAYGVWGDCVGRAVDLAAHAPGHGVLVDEAAVEALPEGLMAVDPPAGAPAGSLLVRRR